MSKPKKKKSTVAKKSEAGNKRRKKVAKKSGKPLDNLLTTVRTHPDDIAARLDLAEYYSNNGQPQNIEEALKGLQDRYPFPDRKERSKYNLLAAVGYVHHKQLVLAERAAQQGLEDTPDSLPFLFLLTEVHLRLREFDKVIKYACRFIEQHEQAGSTPVDSGVHAQFRDIGRVHDFLGTAYKETGRVEQAETNYRLAIEFDPGDHRPYINLVRLLKTTGNIEAAVSIVDKGVSVCRQVQELRMMKTSLEKKTTVSACMMVKNEEDLLPGCLDSIRDWVDEIIVVDTGSTDKTVEIAKSFGAKIYHQPWEDNFSKHRNYTVELATCEWVFIIDADERFDQSDVASLLSLINSPQNSIVSMSVFNRYAGAHDFVIGSNSVRFWRRSLNLRYEGIVHNALEIPDGSVITRTPFKLEHIGYDLTPEKMTAKFHRTMDLLQKQLDENPKNGDTWFNLTQLLRGRLDDDSHELAEKAVEAAINAVKYTDPDASEQRAIHVMSLNHVAAISFIEDNLDRAIEYAQRALVLKPDYLDPLMLLAMTYNRQDEPRQALEAYQVYLNAQAEFNEQEDPLSLILYFSRGRDAAYYGMGKAALALNDAQKAREYFRAVLDQTPDFSDAAMHLGHLYLIENRLPEAQEQFENQLKGNSPLALAAAGLGYISSLQGDKDAAIGHYLQAVELEPENAIVLGKCGAFFHETGEFEKAATYIERSLVIDDSQTLLKRHLGELRFSAGLFEEAAELYRDILKTGGDNAEDFNDLGNCCFKMNQLEAAVEHYTNATQCSEPPAFVFRNLGLALAAQHKAKEASAALVTYAAMEPEDKDLACLLGDLYVEQGLFQQALEQYEKFLLARPNDVLGVYKLSECYRAMGHGDSAAMGYRRVLELDPNFTPARKKLTDATTSVST